MPDWIVSDGPARRVGVLLFERFSNHCLANTVEPLRAANTILGRQAYLWEILTPDGGTVRSSSGLPVSPERRLSEGRGGEVLFLMPSYGYRALATPAMGRALRDAARRWRVVAGLDCGAWLMAAAGLLEGRQATIHYDEWQGFAERFPEVAVRRARWVEDGTRITAGGAMTAFELVLHLIGRDHGTALALEVGRLFMSPEAVAAPLPAAGRGDARVARAVALMRERTEAPLTVAAIAAGVGISVKELEGRFRRALGAGPAAVYRRLRLEEARRMLAAGGMSVAEAAMRSGYEDASAFARAFRREFGVSPRSVKG